MKLLNGFLCLIILALGIGANAASVNITSVANASNFVMGASPADTPVIYGATAGDPCVSKLGANEFCNNCTDSYACSQKRIHADLLLRIEFMASTEGYIAFGMVKNGYFEKFPASIFNRSTTNSLSKGNLGYVEIKWGTLCKMLNEDDETCETADITQSLFVALSNDSTITIDEVTLVDVKIFAPLTTWKDNSDEISCTDDEAGICSVAIIAGDQKVYIDSIKTTGSFPTMTSVPAAAMRFYYSDVQGSDLREINYASPFVDIGLDSAGLPIRDYIEGLSNDLFYGFKVAIVDEAMNVSSMISTTQIDEECMGYTTLDASCDAVCQYVVKPSAIQQFPYSPKVN